MSALTADFFEIDGAPYIGVLAMVTASSYTLADLDSITGGVFHAATSGERASLLRAWLEKEPAADLMQAVYAELLAKDKGAAKALREKLDEIKRSKNQEAIAAEWADKAQLILAAQKMHIADALAWQRDAAKAGAPLSKEPLAQLKEQLAARIKQIEELQHQTQVQREAALMLLQRLEMLSTKTIEAADAAFAALQNDAQAWQMHAQVLPQQTDWVSLDPKYPAQLDAAGQQMQAMFSAFAAALAAAKTAREDETAALPQMPVWAEEIRNLRGLPKPSEVASTAPTPAAAQDAAARKAAIAAVRAELKVLEKELEEGHGKASVAAANAVRNALKTHGSAIDAKTDFAAQAALAAAAELEGWQRWRANQIRDELIAKAQQLVAEPLPGRKQQETIRQLREQWKQSDQGGMANHAAWKHFDDACNIAHQVVETWLQKVREQEGQVKATRDSLLAQVQAWTEQHQNSQDWRAISRDLQQFAQRWRNAGHLGEKLYAQYQGQWKAAIKAAHAGLEQAQKRSTEVRHALIEEAKQLAAQLPLRLDAVKALQARWQAEAQTLALDRKTEQKLWEAFRTPIDQAFARKGQEREKVQAAVSAHDQAVLAAVAGVDVANASGDAQQIRAAMAALQDVVQNRAAAAPVASNAVNTPATEVQPAQDQDASAENTPIEGAEATGETPIAPTAPAVKKPLIAMRSDDRPGAQRSTPAAASKPANFKGQGRAEQRPNARNPRNDDRPAREQGPRLSNQAFYAQRDALERAQLALKKLSAQAHGEAVVQLLGSWQTRDASQLPTAAQLSKNLPAAVRSKWLGGLTQTPKAAASADEALLRLEMAADVPTPAEHLPARRQLQLQLLTQRHAASPAQTWSDDVASVLASAHADDKAKRLQAVLGRLLRNS